MEQVGFYFNAAACIGCKTCVIACKDKNDLEVGRNFRRVYDFEEGTFPKPRRWHLSIACNHCDSPSCVSHCPTKAMHKREEDGVVVVDHTLCVGCRYCTWACPYEAPQFDEASGMMTKCDTCLNLRAKGENPACVDACPMRALDFGPISELRKKYGNNADIAGLPDSSLTRPNLIVGTKTQRGY
ncbi:DMSO/selenate family reductase complex B subunit [Escherichia coli O5:H32]|uniref:Dimethylsulfoxide reductase subunit B n=2 Tax=Escherichia coli TaxID=562 RepID=A0A6N6WWX3_ECOLX|nr:MULTISPECIES: DMSO/selenate family reductase complex B subunit [Enterobacteriaceae]EAR4674257.1 dimethylsulfoxide reductase subunit B [Salmonella enterica]EAT3277185.1 dimethylsulfoxide reductase subunit B [Salmonella enterica subsp. enterica serovar Senftenberg]ECY3218019.1 dimethylsulfoxide reductase subunit B [Salmonella enterica subsp. enterica serovar Rissen]EDF3927186.1 dimethylsulfoxide reductase subunit B [Salmonella enterica subsp. enterica serovar Schwarzengrund]EDT9061133.1 dimet